MLRLFSLSFLLLQLVISQAQIYVLKDHRDSFATELRYDSLPTLCDSFFSKVKLQDSRIIKQFVPTLESLKASIDTNATGFKESDLVFRQEFIQKKLEKLYAKSLKQAKKDNIKFKFYELSKKQYQFGKSEDGNEFCYVTLTCVKKKKTLNIRFLAIRLDGAWYMADDLSLVWD